MTRAELLALLAAPAVSARPGMSVVVRLAREGTAPLAPFTVLIALRNDERHTASIAFPTADLFRIDVLRDGAPIWSSLTGRTPIPVDRRLSVPPGELRLASVIVDGLTTDRRAYAPGRYLVRVAMLGTAFGVVVDRPIVVTPPLDVAGALRATPQTVVSVRGIPAFVGGVPWLRDPSGAASLRLSRPLGLTASGAWIVRGYLDADGDDRVFAVGRAAPAFENAPSPSP